jgi:hypothetical protein
MTPNVSAIERPVSDKLLPAAPCLSGDLVVDREHTPIGAIDAVIRPSSGVRLIVGVAGYQNRYVVVPAADLVGTIEPPFGPATRRISSQLRLEVLEGPTYRREMGRLIPDQTRVRPFPFPQNADWSASDELSRTAVREALALAPLTANEPVGIDAWHGAVHLHGRISNDAGSIEAMRVASKASGVWHVISTLLSDEAIGMHLRRLVRGSDAAASVAAVSVTHGIGVVTLYHGAFVDPKTLAAWRAATPGLKSLTIGQSPRP